MTKRQRILMLVIGAAALVAMLPLLALQHAGDSHSEIPGWVDWVSATLSHTFRSHPYATVAFVIVLIVNNILRINYPEFTTRPKWARIVVSATDPICGNFWRAVGYFGNKIGLSIGPDGYKEPPPPPEKPTSILDIK